MKEFGTGGKKDTAGKPPVDLVTLKMLEGITEGMTCGMRKGYEKHNWKKGLPICEAHLGAAIRHIYKYIEGEDTNLERATDGTIISTHHLDNALTHLAMAVHQVKSGRIDLDDRELHEGTTHVNNEAFKHIQLGLKNAKEGKFKHVHDWGFDVKRKED